MGLPAQRRLWLAVATLLTRHTYSQFEARTSIFVDDTEVEIVANADRDDFAAVGRDVCARMGVDLGATLRDGRMRCGALIADELADSLYCNATARGALDAALASTGRAPRAFRFYHGEFYFDSEEYELLRELLLRQRYVECLSGERLRGGEDVIWLLGHFDGDAWFYKALEPRQTSNALPQPTELGNKDSLYRHLLALRAKVGDRATRFLPRTWLPDDARASRNGAADELGGLWLRKDPAQELGFGITLITKWSELEGCEHCLLQRYVARPFLLTDAAAGVLDAKFSFGVYVTVSSVDPLEVWLHRELLVLLATYPYDGVDGDDHGESGDLLSHLTNGLLNQRLAGDDFDAAERVWTTDRLLAHLDKRGVSWASIEDQALNGVGGAPSPDHAHYPWLRGACWTDEESPGQPPNTLCAPPDAADDLFGDGAVEPEAAVRARLGAAGDGLLDRAVAATAPLVDAAPLPRAWTSLRYGAGYAYPTHVDCYENVIFQLAGRKNVTIFPPDVVWDTKPDVENKHWPRGGDDDLRRARRSAVSVELGPGDALYVPLMWPHNVDSDEFSVTANAYLRLGDDADWGDYVDRSKTNAWLAYEIATGTRLC
ncbi:hypothetical protein JL721_3254 [Aureococcus anophagefferens]|nr:hypothetical protein JL721_3254 [Aureococcus anophagefferens]